MDENLLRLAIQAQSDGDFELLVNELEQAALHSTGLRVRKMRAPDGGADTLILDADEQVVGSIQAKHHVRGINWQDCERSLDRAVSCWKPPEITFAFPVDFSENDQKNFKTRLVDRQPDVMVKPLELTALVRMLSEHPEVGPRFFGPDARTIEATIGRTITLGGRTVNTGAELVARARELSAAAGELDPNFDYRWSGGSLSLPEPHWDELPWMTVEVSGARERIRIDAVARPEAGVGLPSFSFTDDEAGAAALESARQTMARGERLEITEGLRVRIAPAPEVLRELVSGQDMSGTGTLIIEPTEPTPCDVHLHGERPVERRFMVRPVFPTTGADVAFAVDADALWFELTLRLPGAPKVEMNVTASPRFGSSAAANADAAALHDQPPHRRVVQHLSPGAAAGIGRSRTNHDPLGLRSIGGPARARGHLPRPCVYRA